MMIMLRTPTERDSTKINNIVQELRTTTSKVILLPYVEADSLTGCLQGMAGEAHDVRMMIQYHTVYIQLLWYSELLCCLVYFAVGASDGW
jgi:hypothetical protein